mmetsp:Transcript_69839/g.110856  ORF Transcript_69839/g.110856 Transcript_69839/m.110856 type:complete len:92 (-) Transcript_69839:59-334(-)
MLWSYTLLLQTVGSISCSSAFIVLLVHIVLGAASAGGEYGNDGSGGVLSILFCVALVMGCFAFAATESKRLRCAKSSHENAVTVVATVADA